MGELRKVIRASWDSRFVSKQFSRKIAAAKKIGYFIGQCGNAPFWLQWYFDSQIQEIKMLKKTRFIPRRFFRNDVKKLRKNYEDAIKILTKDDRVYFKEIVLPALPENTDAAYYSFSFYELSDNILTYLLEECGISEEIYYAAMDMTFEGPYEYKSVRIEKDDIVIDAGAGSGEFSALASVRGGRAYAFEPMQRLVDVSKTAELNPNIIVCKQVLSNKKEELYFDENETAIVPASKIKQYNSDMVKIQAINLDTFVHENNLPRVDFIKADIEGAERYMLMGAKRVLKEFAPKIAICTYHLPDDPQVLRQLILDENPNYIIEERWKKMYAYVPK